jgi:hypothetical protein
VLFPRVNETKLRGKEIRVRGENFERAGCSTPVSHSGESRRDFYHSPAEHNLAQFDEYLAQSD